MALTIHKRCISVFQLSVLILLKLSTVLGSWEKRTFPLPVLPGVTYGIDDVIIRPIKSTSLVVNATFVDLDSNATYCELSTTKEMEFQLPLNDDNCNITGLALTTSMEAALSINISGNELSLLPIYNMGEKYVIPEDFERHRTDHINSLLIYTTAKNTTVSVCFDQKFGGHLSEQFNDQLTKWIDGELQCYRKTLGRCEIWMINNASVHRGIEIIANNPIGVLQCHSSNSSSRLQNGSFIDDPQNDGTKIVRDRYPPLKFWGKRYILFPGSLGGQRNITVIAEKDAIVFLNSSSQQSTIQLQGRLRVSIALEQTQWVTLNGSSKMIVSSLFCDSTNSYGTFYHIPFNSPVTFEQITDEENVGFNLVCTSPPAAWTRNDENRTHFAEKGDLYLGNQRLYFASLTDKKAFELRLLNYSENDCFLTRQIDSKSCMAGKNSFYRNEAGRNSSISVPINDSHLTNVRREYLIDSSSRVVIEVHKNDNVNKSSYGNFSDMGLKENKTELIRNRSDKQIASNRTWLSVLETMKTNSSSTITLAPFHILSKGQTDMVSFSSDIRGNRSENSSTTRVPFVTDEKGSTNYHLNEFTTNKPHTMNEDGISQINMGSTDNLVLESNLPNGRDEITTNGYVSKQKLLTSNKDSLKSNLFETHENQNSIITNDTRRMISKIKKLLNSSEIKDSFPTPSTPYPSQSYESEIEQLSNMSILISRKGSDNINNEPTSKQTYRSNVRNDLQVPNSTKGINPSKNSNSTKTNTLSNDRFKVVVDIVSSGRKDININPRVRYESKNPTYVYHDNVRGKFEQVGDGKSLVAVIVSLSSAVFAVIAIILVFFFIEYFSRRKQLRKTRIRPFLSDY